MKQVISFSLDKSLIDRFRKTFVKYGMGSLSGWVSVVLLPAINCISEHGLDEYKRRLKG